MDFRKKISDMLRKKINYDIDFYSMLENPPDPSLGDWAFPCFVLSRELKKNPSLIAKDLEAKIKPDKYISRIEAKGPYLNFFINFPLFAEKVISEINNKKSKYGSSNKGKGKSVVMDFSSPNIAKPFSIAHLRSTAIGNALSNLYEFVGYKTIRINHLGDWGTQFGKLIVAYHMWGDEKKLKKEPIKHLLDIYVKFHKATEQDDTLNDAARMWFKALEEGDKRAVKLWNLFRKESLKEFKRLYSRLGIKFDFFWGEAFYIDKVKDTINMLKNKNLLVESEGAFVVECNNIPPCIIIKRDGATTYPARDICAAIYRYDRFRFYKMIYVVDVRQSLHFEQVFCVLKRAKLRWADKVVHVKFGLMQFEKGDVMSTREGKVVFLEDVMNKTVDLVKNIINKKNPHLRNKQKVAEEVGIGAIFFWDLFHDRTRPIVFEWKNVLDFEGETGPYVQYSYARASSILRKLRKSGRISGKADFSLLASPKEINLVKMLSLFKDVVLRAVEDNSPSVLAKYLIDSAHAFNEFYQTCSCLGADDKGLRRARLAIVAAFRQVMKNGLKLLGIKAPEEM